jgi:protein-disulfide isomerase
MVLLLLCARAQLGLAALPQAPAAPHAAAPPPVTLDPRRSLGSAHARVGIVEFSDLQCPYCRSFHQDTLPSLKARYIDTGKLRYSYRDFPLDLHEQAAGAAVAARCAGRQGAYWRMQRALFENRRHLVPALYPDLAKSLRLDAAAFRACVSGGREAAGVREDVAYGGSLGVNATPHFFIGRLSGTRLLSPRSIVGTQSLESFEAIIKELLRH